MRNRRAIASLALATSAPLALVALWQLGAIKHLPDPPLRLFDAEKVNGSAQAYDKLATPDAILGIGSAIATMGLAGMGGPDRAKSMPLIPIAFAAKVFIDALVAGKLTVDQWTKYRAFCMWCLLSAAATFAMVPLVIPEALAALRPAPVSRTSR
jgi:hypothetical protein